MKYAIVTFCQLDTNLAMPGKRESQMEGMPRLDCLRAHLWSLFLIANPWEFRSVWVVPPQGRWVRLYKESS